MLTQHLETLLVILLCMVLVVNGQYQWSCSPLDTANNRYTIPDLGITDDGDVADIGERLTDSLNVVYIFPLPATLNCSGTVSAVQYCYSGNSRGTEQPVFTLLTLEMDGTTFTITDTVSVSSTPTEEICTTRGMIPILGITSVDYCCDILALNVANQFMIPSPNFAFGVVPVDLLTYRMRSSNAPFLVSHYRVEEQQDIDTTVGSVLTFSEEDDLMDDRALTLLQFSIIPAAPTNMELTTQTIEFKTDPGLPDNTVIHEPDVSTSESGSDTTTTQQELATDSAGKGSLPSIIGAVMAVFLLVVALAITVLLLVIVRKVRTKTVPRTSEEKDINEAYFITPHASPIADDSYEMIKIGNSTDIPAESNAAYVPTPSILVEANAAYITTPSIPMEANAAYATVSDTDQLYATVSDTDQLYATPGGENGPEKASPTPQQLTTSADYDYVC